MKNRKIIASFMLALSLVGCTGLEAGKGGYTAGGAAGGAAVGALAGQIIGKDTKGTLIGAAVGSLLGMGWGAYRDNQERELKAKLQGTQAEVRKDGNALVINLPGGVTFASDRLLKTFGAWTQGELETLESLEQLRILENGQKIAIDVAKVALPLGVDTQDDLDRLNAMPIDEFLNF